MGLELTRVSIKSARMQSQSSLKATNRYRAMNIRFETNNIRTEISVKLQLLKS